MFCAGPKKGSGSEWAIMMRSRTSTENMANGLALIWVADDGKRLAACGSVNSLGSASAAASKGMSSATRQSRTGSSSRPNGALKPVARGDACPAGGRDVADLRGDDLKALCMKGAAEIDRDRGRAVPAHLDDAAFEGAAVDSDCSPAAVAEVWKTRRRSPGRGREGEREAEARRRGLCARRRCR